MHFRACEADHTDDIQASLADILPAVQEDIPARMVAVGEWVYLPVFEAAQVRAPVFCNMYRPVVEYIGYTCFSLLS